MELVNSEVIAAGIHEAGHAVVAAGYFGFVVPYTILFPRGGGATRVKHPKPPKQDDIRAEVLVMLAGPITEARYYERDLDGLLPGAGTISCSARHLVTHLTPSVTIESLEPACERLVAYCWGDILRIASILVVRRRLEADEIAELLGRR